MRIIELYAERMSWPSSRQRIKGVEFHVILSPYFFPDRLECQYDRQRGTLSIRFRYPDFERGVEQRCDALVSFFVGVHSGRLLEVRIRVDGNALDQVRPRVTEAASAISQLRSRQPDLADNYLVATRALRDHNAEIAETVPATL